jgi:hypothetical protein
MPNSGDNVRFQLLINGKSLGVGGMEATGVVSLIVSWVRRDPAAAPADAKAEPEFDPESWVDNEIDVRLGGLDLVRQEHMDWAYYSAQVGDEIVLRILPPGPFDEPSERSAIGTRGGCSPHKETAGHRPPRKGRRGPKPDGEPT